MSMLGERKDVDIIFIRDTESLWYQAGTYDALGSFTSIVQYLRENIQGYKRIIAMGASMGGYAALAVMPLMTKIDCCIAIAPQAFIDSENRERYGDTRWSDRMEIINKALRRTPFFDLKPFYQKKHNGRPVHIYYGENARHDKNHALYMQGIDGIKLHEVKGADHFAGRVLRDTGILENIIQQAIIGSDLGIISEAKVSSR